MLIAYIAPATNYWHSGRNCEMTLPALYYPGAVEHECTVSSLVWFVQHEQLAFSSMTISTHGTPRRSLIGRM